MQRSVVLLALVACEPREQAPEPASEPPPLRWLYTPSAGGFPLGASRGRLGRSQAPQPIVELGIAGPGGPAGAPSHLAPLRLPIAWPIPGAGPARAVVYGSDGDHPAIELIELDAGRVVWRDEATCAAPIVGATAEAIVCADAGGTRAIGIDGKPRWATRAPFLAFTDDRVVTSAGDEAVVLDAGSGGELARIRLPRGVAPETIVASCGDAGRELFAVGRDDKLVLVAEAQGGPAIRWSTPLGVVTAVDSCDGDTVAVNVLQPAGLSRVALARATGKITGRIDGVRGIWPARDGSDRVEVSTARGVASYPRDLAGPPAPIDLPPLGELLASRGHRRLIRATTTTAVVLDRDGVRAYLPFAAIGAVLGDDVLLAMSWTGSPGETVHRLALPPRWTRRLRLPGPRRGVALDAELRDLPPVLPLDAAAASALPDTGMRRVAGYALDPGDGAAVYALARNRDGNGAGVARADLATRQWRWQRVDGCGAGQPVAIAVARDVVVCGTRGAEHPELRPQRSTVRATSRDGAARWEWTTANLDAMTAGGDVVVVHDADRLTVLDARDGRVRGHVTSDDTAATHAAVVALAEATLVITVERGRVVARLGIAGLLPLWSIEVAGVVRALSPSGDGVVVALEDGDAYRIDARTAAITALPGIGLTWHAAGDVVTGHTAGGPVPGVASPARPPTASQLLRRPLQLLRLEISPPPMSTPVKPPPSLGDSWQLTLYELTGGLRARNDYALPAPVAPPAMRGPAGSPLVIACGPGLREVIVLDPRTGAPLRRVQLPEDAEPGAVFGTVVDGSPVAGAVLGSPLRVVQF